MSSIVAWDCELYQWLRVMGQVSLTMLSDMGKSRSRAKLVDVSGVWRRSGESAWDINGFGVIERI